MENRTKEILEHIPQGLLQLDSKGQITSEFSKNCLNFLETNNLEGLFFHEVIFKENEVAKKDWLQSFALFFENTFMEFSQVSDLLPKEIKISNKDGTENFYNLTYYPCRDNENNLIGIDIGIENISEKHNFTKIRSTLEAERLILQQIYDSGEAYFGILTILDETLVQLSALVIASKLKHVYSKEEMAALTRNLQGLKGSSGLFSLNQAQGTILRIEDCIKHQWDLSSEEFAKSIQILTAELRKNCEEAHKLVAHISEELRRRLTGIVLSREIYNKLNVAADTNNILEVKSLLALVEKIPARNLVASWPNEVKLLSESLGKKIKFVQKDDNIVIAKEAYQCLQGVLPHFLKYSIYQSIELPNIRLEEDKDEIGFIQFFAFFQDREFVIEISDDGEGLDVAKIAAKARSEKKLDQALIEKHLKNHEAWKILFMSGFHMREEIKGMDGALKILESSKGTLEVENNTGRGVIFRIRLPR